MAYSPSEKWENGRLVERNIETNRWKILPDGTAVPTDPALADTGAETVTKAVTEEEAENKSVRSRSTSKK